MTKTNNQNPLWTRDFTIITIGSVVSMFGNAMAGFAMSLMVLDISESTLLYAIFIAAFTIPQLFMPLISGAFLDRFSRKKTIYTLDFVSAFLDILMAVILFTGWFSFPVFIIYCLVIGTIQSTYMVAYESFYPLLISEGNYQKAYSIASVLETMSAVMVPVSTFLYGKIGLAPLLIVNGVCFFIAAVMETQIKAEEHYIEKQKETRAEGTRAAKQILLDMKEGFQYFAAEKGLLAIAAYFVISSVCGGVSEVIVLPYFKSTFENGQYWYIFVMAFMLAGRAIGGFIHYKIKIPAKHRYLIAFVVYIVISVCEGFYLFFPFPVMMALCFIIGIGGVTSYTIRISATQSYVPDEKKGRFNGAFNMLMTVGMLIGEFAAGALSKVVSERIILMSAMLLCAVCAVLFIGGGRKHVAKIYNRIE
ncbi:MAG: MFS transporter [Lachnospiraceae bacterium]|nr:MFS transporter [Lachnospiraceae bacterium]